MKTTKEYIIEDLDRLNCREIKQVYQYVRELIADSNEGKKSLNLFTLLSSDLLLAQLEAKYTGGTIYDFAESAIEWSKVLDKEVSFSFNDVYLKVSKKDTVKQIAHTYDYMCSNR